MDPDVAGCLQSLRRVVGFVVVVASDPWEGTSRVDARLAVAIVLTTG
jgi:hypothetical protein